MESKYFFYKKHKTDTMYWVEEADKIGRLLVSFDKKKVYNLWTDYPSAFSSDELAIFKKENPYWAEYFG